jgi:hypothetical protein
MPLAAAEAQKKKIRTHSDCQENNVEKGWWPNKNFNIKDLNLSVEMFWSKECGEKMCV